MANFVLQFVLISFTSPRRSVEERPGTPTIDEHNQDIQAPSLPDTSVPPPNFPPGEEPPFASTTVPAPPVQPQQQPPQSAAQPIETLGARSQYRMTGPHSYRGEHPYGPIRYENTLLKIRDIYYLLNLSF